MKKLKLVGMLAAVVMLMFIVVASYLSEKNVDEPEELYAHEVNKWIVNTFSDKFF